MATKTIDSIKPLNEVVNQKKQKTNNEGEDLIRIVKNRQSKYNVKFKILDERASMPAYAHDGDIGMDVKCIDIEYDAVHDAFIYHTGLACETSKNVGCFLMPRSSNMKTESYMPNGIGLVDSYTYRDELLFVFKNRTDIDLIAAMSAMTIYDELPVWKKPFTSFREVWDKESERIKQSSRILRFAPYDIGDRIGQMVFFEYPNIKVEEVEELSQTERTGGFGSTGK